MDASRVLREWRARSGRTQTDVAAAAGLRQPALARLEGGVATPRLDTFERALEALGLELEVRRRRGIGVDTAPIRRLLRLTPGARLRHDPPRRGWRPDVVLRYLVGRRVEMVLVGDAAERLHGAPVPVSSIEIVFGPARWNEERLARAVGRLRRTRVEAEEIRGLRRIRTLEGTIEVVRLPASRFALLAAAASTVSLGSFEVPVASIDDLVQRRERAGPRDRAELLAATRRELDRLGS